MPGRGSFCAPRGTKNTASADRHPDHTSFRYQRPAGEPLMRQTMKSSRSLIKPSTRCAKNTASRRFPRGLFIGRYPQYGGRAQQAPQDRHHQARRRARAVRARAFKRRKDPSFKTFFFRGTSVGADAASAREKVRFYEELRKIRNFLWAGRDVRTYEPCCGTWPLLRDIPENRCKQFRDFLHVLNRDILEPAVEVFTARTEIRAGKPFEREPRAVRSAADRLYLRGNAELQHGAFRLIDEEHAGLDFLLPCYSSCRES